MSIDGALYMPGTAVDFPNSVSFISTTCTIFVAKSLAIRNGNGSMTASGCASSFGNAIFLTASIAQ
jgi:hypothetical protein